MRELLIDGSEGEGGGQILRTSLCLSVVTGRPFRITGIRAGRPRPGLLRQHLTAVQAAAAISGADVSPTLPGTAELTFRPGPVRPGDHRFSVGTAGSATLVLQTVLPALARAAAPSHLVLEGGTHNPAAPPWDFLARTWLPLLCRMGPGLDTRLARHGFHPAGGGRFSVQVRPATAWSPLQLMERGPLRRRRARALVSNLPRHIAERELEALTRALGLQPGEASAEEVTSPGPGNVLLVELEARHLTEVFTGFGRKGVPSERVAFYLAGAVDRYLAAGVPVGPYLADQLLVPLALARGGAFLTTEPSLHARTNAAVIQRFLEVPVRFVDRGRGLWEVRVGSEA